MSYIAQEHFRVKTEQEDKIARTVYSTHFFHKQLSCLALRLKLAKEISKSLATAEAQKYAKVTQLSVEVPLVLRN